jgi:hypothetical protein
LIQQHSHSDPINGWELSESKKAIRTGMFFRFSEESPKKDVVQITNPTTPANSTSIRTTVIAVFLRSIRLRSPALLLICPWLKRGRRNVTGRIARRMTKVLRQEYSNSKANRLEM